MVGSDVYLCFKRSLNMAEKISYQVSLEEDPSQCLNFNFFKKKTYFSRLSSTISLAPTLTTASHWTQKRFCSLLKIVEKNSDQFCPRSGSPVLPATWSEYRSVAEQCSSRDDHPVDLRPHPADRWCCQHTLWQRLEFL